MVYFNAFHLRDGHFKSLISCTWRFEFGVKMPGCFGVQVFQLMVRLVFQEFCDMAQDTVHL